MEPEKVNPWPRKEDAKEYLTNHRILDLFDNMTSMLIFEQPVNPKEFLIEKLEALQVSKATKSDYPCMFDESNIHAQFGMLDPTGRGFISLDQYRNALTTLGLTDFNPSPSGSEVNKISLETFTVEAKGGLFRKSATFDHSVPAAGSNTSVKAK